MSQPLAGIDLPYRPCGYRADVGVDEGTEGKWVEIKVCDYAADDKSRYVSQTSCDAADGWNAGLDGMGWWYK